MSGSSQHVTRDKLWSYDAGSHTCTVYDAAGNTGRATTVMNIVGMYGCYHLYLYINQVNRK